MVNQSQVQPQEKVDVLIVGAGPAGLMLATWLSKLKISTRIIDKRNDKVFTGQADGVQCRTVEVFQSFGFAERLVKEGAHINECVFWHPQSSSETASEHLDLAPAVPDEDGRSRIVRTKRTPDNRPGTSRFPHAVLTQGRIEKFMLDAMLEFDGLKVERSMLPTSLDVDSHLVDASPTSDSYPITVKVRHLTEEESTPQQNNGSQSASETISNGLFRSNLVSEEEERTEEAKSNSRATQGNVEEEVIKAKYVVGCDGARSWVRKQMGLTLDGDSAGAAWGVLDAIVITDFPDIRLKCTIHSKDQGSILVVPRERNLVRFYVQLGSVAPGERYDRDSVTPDSILDKARAIMYPYKLETPFVEWFTCYEIGQRLCKQVTNDERVFIAGDAFHTHSPKAGQGMNISMGDTYNLGWKLAHVIQGRAHPKILSTYHTERHQTAQELIDIDYKFSRMFSKAPTEDGAAVKGEGVSMQEFKEFFVKLGDWASGTAVHYQPSLVVAPQAAQSIAPGLPHGKRFESHQVISMADARPWHIGDRMESDGRWRLVIFAGDLRVSAQRRKLDTIAAYLDSSEGPIRRYTTAGADIDSVIEILTVISNSRITHEPNDFPDILWPTKSPYGSRDYLKIFSDDDSWFSGHGQIYEKLGINKEEGCLVLVRPDQTVALVTQIDQGEEVATFLGQFMIPV